MPDMIRQASSPRLKGGLQSHLHETERHVERLEQAFKLLGQKASAVDFPAIDGIIAEAKAVGSEVAGKDVLDAAIAAAGQAVEHYEIARYGSLIAWARKLGHKDVADLLEQTLSEEKAAEQTLAGCAAAPIGARTA
jgi:ferritin-like metal-binding protein YciE